VPTQAVPSFSGERAMRHAEAQMQWVPRDTGTAGWRQCGDYIVAQLKGAGWQVEEQAFPYREVQCRNIIGKRGSGPRIIVGAHYDSRRYADQDPDQARRTFPVPAANDGASGVAVLLELARVIQPEEFGREVWLAAFDAEDNGDLDGWEWTVGSAYMADHLGEAPQAVIVLDMIGDADLQIYFETNSDEPIRQAIWDIAAELGYASFVPQNRFSMLDDHTPFLRRGYRAVDIIDFNYPAWHTTADTLDKISAASLEAVGRTIETWLRRGGPEAHPGYPSPTA
jgi:Zn-dependent M28 family amino/carboxypeptidase